MKYLLICIALLTVFISCDDDSIKPEPPVGYFIVDSLFVTCVVERDFRDEIVTWVNIRYVYHFEKSRGYVSCREVSSTINEYASRFCIMDPAPHAADHMFDDEFGRGIGVDYSYLDSVAVNIQIDGRFTGGDCYNSESDRCRFTWKDEVTVPVENGLE